MLPRRVLFAVAVGESQFDGAGGGDEVAKAGELSLPPEPADSPTQHPDAADGNRVEAIVEGLGGVLPGAASAVEMNVMR